MNIGSRLDDRGRVQRGVRLFVGGHCHSVAGEPFDLGGDRCLTAVHPAPAHTDTTDLHYVLDSGAFSDPWERRLTPEQAFDRQLRFEQRSAETWGVEVPAQAWVSYDLLIDEVWTDGERTKRRWSVADAEHAVRETVEAAAYLSSQRYRLGDRTLVLSCQGVDAGQYTECVAAVLEYAGPGDWIGLGGFCILGRAQTWLPEFRRTIARSMPLIAGAGVTRCHIFGVLWEPALAALLWCADQYGISVSTDSTAPVLAATRGNPRKAGMRGTCWRTNVIWWKAHLANLRQSRYYGPFDASQQATMWERAT